MLMKQTKNFTLTKIPPLMCERHSQELTSVTLFDIGGAIVYAIMGTTSLLAILFTKYVLKKKWSRALEEKIQLVVFAVFVLVIVVFVFLWS